MGLTAHSFPLGLPGLLLEHGLLALNPSQPDHNGQQYGGAISTIRQPLCNS